MLIARHALAEPLLTAEQETELALRIEAGVLARQALVDGWAGHDVTETELRLVVERGEQARARYVAANLRLVAKIAAEAAARTRLPEGDLFQEGCLGLITAVERFDCRRGYRFSTYATFWVRAHVSAAVAGQCGSLNLPASRAHQLQAVRRAEVELSVSRGRSVSTAEVAASVGRSEKWTRELLAHQAPQPFDFTATDPVDLAPRSWTEVEVKEDRPGIELLTHLDEVEREVLALRYGFADGTAHSCTEIGRRLHLSVSRVRRLEQRALEVLRGVCPQSAVVHL